MLRTRLLKKGEMKRKEKGTRKEGTGETED